MWAECLWAGASSYLHCLVDVHIWAHNDRALATQLQCEGLQCLSSFLTHATAHRCAASESHLHVCAGAGAACCQLHSACLYIMQLGQCPMAVWHYTFNMSNTLPRRREAHCLPGLSPSWDKAGCMACSHGYASAAASRQLLKAVATLRIHRGPAAATQCTELAAAANAELVICHHGKGLPLNIYREGSQTSATCIGYGANFM